MKFAFSLKNKLKMAFLLFCIMCCTLLIRFLEDKSVSKINESFISMYNDRLVPATDLYFIAENLYHKNTLLLDAMEKNTHQQDIQRNQFERYYQRIDSVIRKYERTVLVSQEQDYLQAFKSALSKERKLEARLLRYPGAEAEKAYDQTGRKVFAETQMRLSALIKIQSEVGNDLIKDSKIFVSGTKVYSFFQVVLAVAIGMLIVNIVSASRVDKMTSDKFNLN